MGRRGQCLNLRVFWFLLCLVGSWGRATLHWINSLICWYFWSLEGCIVPHGLACPFPFVPRFLLYMGGIPWCLHNKIYYLSKERKITQLRSCWLVPCIDICTSNAWVPYGFLGLMLLMLLMHGSFMFFSSKIKNLAMALFWLVGLFLQVQW